VPAGRQDPMEKLKAAFDEWQNEREARTAIENDPKKAGAELAKDLREFLGEWKASKAARAQGGSRPAAKSDDDDSPNILSALFGG
jgi:hypothetical protein